MFKHPMPANVAVNQNLFKLINLLYRIYSQSFQVFFSFFSHYKEGIDVSSQKKVRQIISLQQKKNQETENLIMELKNTIFKNIFKL